MSSNFVHWPIGDVVPFGGVDPRVVHDDVEPPERLDAGVHNSLGVLEHRDIARRGYEAPPEFLDRRARRRESVRVATADRHGGSLTSERLGDREANAAGGSCHESPLSFKQCHDVSFRWWDGVYAWAKWLRCVPSPVIESSKTSPAFKKGTSS